MPMARAADEGQRRVSLAAAALAQVLVVSLSEREGGTTASLHHLHGRKCDNCFHHLAPAYSRFRHDTCRLRRIARLGRAWTGIEVEPRAQEMRR
jgi:hypothetical protein